MKQPTRENKSDHISRRTVLQTTAGLGVGTTLGINTVGAQSTICNERSLYEDFEDGLDDWEQGGDVSLSDGGVVTPSTVRITDSEEGEGSTGRISWECAGEFSTHDEFELRGVYQAVTDASFNYRFGIVGDDRYLLKIDPGSDAIGFGNTTYTSVSGETIDSAFIGTWTEFRLYFDGTGTVNAKVWEYGQPEPDDWQISTEFARDTGTVIAAAGQNQHGRELLVDELEIHESPSTTCDGTPRYEDFEGGLDDWEQGGDVSLSDGGVVTNSTARITDSEEGEGSTGRISWECAGEFSTHDEFELRGVYQAATGSSFNYRFGIVGDDRHLLKIDPGSDAIGFGNTTYTSVSGETIDSAFIGTWAEFRLYFDGTGTVNAKVWEYGRPEPNDWQISTEFTRDTGIIIAAAGQNQHGRELLVDELEIDETTPGQRVTDNGDGHGDDGDDGSSDEDSEPTASFTFSPSPPEVGQRVAFNAEESTAPTGEIDSYSWDFDDGATASGETATYTFEETGGYNIELIIETDHGESDTTRETIAVEGTVNNDDVSDDGFGPGFGIGGAISGVAGLGYLLQRRLDTEQQD